MVPPAIELLAPAGNPEALDAAVAEGADAVYLGLKAFNARMRSANFAYSQFEGALRSLHRMGRRLYVTLNTVFEQREADQMYQLLRYLASAGPDGIIVQDFGILMMAREFPGLKLHASTQMNIASARGANALSKYGVSRAVLARELSLEEIRSVRQGTNLELETFVHGALCVSASGLCLFSSYLGGKSANRGLCTQACRRLYRTESGVLGGAPGGGSGGVPGGGVSSGASGAQTAGYYFSPCDLSLIGRIPELAEAGVGSFKIEGRMKSAEYVGTVVSAYRRVIDSLDGGEDDRRRALEEAGRILRNDFARPKTEFFFSSSASAFLRPDQDGGTGISLGIIAAVRGSGAARRALVKAGGFTGAAPAPGDSVRFHRADDSRRLTHKLSAAEHDGRGLSISVPEGFEPGDSVYLIQTKAMTRRYPPVIPGDLGSFRRQPGREKAPRPPIAAGRDSPAELRKALPEGIYAAAATAEDLYVIQSVRPAAVILPVNRKTAAVLRDDRTLPFKAPDIILALDPYFPQGEEAFLREALGQLMERGFRRFILNNPGHVSFFPKDKAFTLIAGPWLYTFNSWALAFTGTLGASAFIAPLEINRQNLEKTVPPRLRPPVFVTLFAWPPLFRIRGGLRYRFRQFTGSRGESFSLINGGEDNSGGVVIPGEPFSIVDKRPFLMEAGFRRFILDFSAGVFNGTFPLKKKLYKEVMKAAEEVLPLPRISRFNWKNGFYSEK
ncbi:MAG: U32 family peptidase [Treponema sp.]|jgi:putative protease|nr:U32 family peptidase [Treponema sp.]